MSRLVLIDGNSIMNRAFYGIMGNKMLTTSDGTYTNAVYGFLTILFKIQEDLKPEYLAVAFDLKGPTKRHEIYKEYKANRHGMPDELAVQMPIIKNILKAMNINILELQGYEGDDILGTMSLKAEKDNIDVTILSGDRDTFQLVSDKITVRIPRTKMGKTEYEDYNKERILEEYKLCPEQLIDVKGLMGDSSDNIPGVPGIGEKTALNLINNYKSIENLYEQVENSEVLLDIRGKLKEKILQNKELAYISRTLGTIDRKVPIECDLNNLKIKGWNKEEVYNLFKYLNFNRFLERFNMLDLTTTNNENEKTFNKKSIQTLEEINNIIKNIEKQKEIIYFLDTKTEENSIINKRIAGICIYIAEEKCCYYICNNNNEINLFKDLFENPEIKKVGYKQKEDYILLKEAGINITNIYFDVSIAAYILNPTENNYNIEKLAIGYLNINIEKEHIEEQINLFKMEDSKEDKKIYLVTYAIYEIYKKTSKELEETNQIELFNEIEMPLTEVLADMQYQGIYADRTELISFGSIIKEEVKKLTNKIYEIAGEEFNINSTKQLGNILFDKLGLPVVKKTKNGYSTDVEVLEKLRTKHEIIDIILEYRQLVKLNSTYIEGLIPYIRKR